MVSAKQRDVIAGICALGGAAVALVILFLWMRQANPGAPIAPPPSIAVQPQPPAPAATVPPAPSDDPFADVPLIAPRTPPPSGPPFLEQLRGREERAHASEPFDSIAITPVHTEACKVTRLSNTYFVIEQQAPVWFLLKVTGAKDRTIRLDFPSLPAKKWSSLNPVYSYCPNLDDPAFFKSDPNARPRPPVESHNGPLLPDTGGQQWHYIPAAWTDNATEIHSIVHTFDSDLAWIAARTPYLPGFAERYAEQLRKNPLARVIEVGRGSGGSPLHVIQIGGGTDEAGKSNPCILMYARERASDHDASWVAQGAVEFLLSDSPDARNIRDKFTFLIIPLLDPDGAEIGAHQRISSKFFPAGRDEPEVLAYAAFFRQWVKAGRRLDLAFNLANSSASAHSHLFCPLLEPDPDRRRAGESLHNLIAERCTQAGFEVEPPKKFATDHWRLGGYLSKFYGPLHIVYEANSQDGTRHLTLAELRQLGELLVRGSSHFLTTPSFDPLLASIFDRRHQHEQRMEKYEKLFADRKITSALQIEWGSWRAEVEAQRKPPKPASPTTTPTQPGAPR